MPFAALFRLIQHYTKIFALFLAYLAVFSYLCTIKHPNYQYNHHATNPKQKHQPTEQSSVNCQLSARPEGALATERDARTVNKYIWPNAVGPNVFPLHPAEVCLGEAEVTPAGRSRPRAPCDTPPSHVPSGGSKHYLPTPWAAMTALFRGFSRLRTFPKENPDFP